MKPVESVGVIEELSDDQKEAIEQENNPEKVLIWAVLMTLLLILKQS